MLSGGGNKKADRSDPPTRILDASTSNGLVYRSPIPRRSRRVGHTVYIFVSPMQQPAPVLRYDIEKIVVRTK